MDFTGIGSAVQGIGGAIGAITNAITGNEARKEAKKNREMLMAIQRENWRREDTAIQRRMTDLKEAGLNPLMAGGVGGAGAGGMLQSLPNPAESMQGIGDAVSNAAMGAGETIAGAGKTQAEIDKMQAETDNINKNMDLIDASVQQTKGDTMLTLSKIKTEKIQQEAMKVGMQLTLEQAREARERIIGYALERQKNDRQIKLLEENVRNSKDARDKMNAERKLIQAKEAQEAVKARFLNYAQKLGQDAGGESAGTVMSVLGGVLGSMFLSPGVGAKAGKMLGKAGSKALKWIRGKK